MVKGNNHRQGNDSGLNFEAHLWTVAEQSVPAPNGGARVPRAGWPARAAVDAAKQWRLNPDSDVGGAPGEAVSAEDFTEQLESLHEELETRNLQARDLEGPIAKNVAEILEA